MHVEVGVLRLAVSGLVLEALARMVGPGPPDRVFRIEPHARILAVPVPQLAVQEAATYRSPDHLLHDARPRVIEPRDRRRAFEDDRPYDGVVPVDDPPVARGRVAHARPELVVGQLR